jgi:hypothetical protein
MNRKRLTVAFEQQTQRSGLITEADRLQAQLVKLQGKRSRVVDSFVEGAIERGERDALQRPTIKSQPVARHY